jgi:hypothetical protein
VASDIIATTPLLAAGGSAETSQRGFKTRKKERKQERERKKEKKTNATLKEIKSDRQHGQVLAVDACQSR